MPISQDTATVGQEASGAGFMPKTRLALNVGITGHRPNKIGVELQDASASTFHALRAGIEAEANSVLRGHAGRLYAPTAPLLRIVTALAEGADRLAVSNLPKTWVFEAILPMPREDYRQDFGSDATSSPRLEFEELLGRAESVTELFSSSDHNANAAQNRSASYGLLGAFLVRQVDILVAMWDGEKSEGAGGTAEVIARAIESGKPVIWIDPAAANVCRSLIAIGSTASTHVTTPIDQVGLQALIGRILLPPVPAKKSEDGHGYGEHNPADALATEPAYFQKSWPKTLYLAFAYMLVRRISGVGRWSWPMSYSPFHQLQKDWDSFFASTEGTADKRRSPSSLNWDLRTILLPRSLWADALAWYYGTIYRSAYISIFMLASLAVPLGLCYLFFLYSPSILDIKAGFVIVELFVVAAIVMLVRRGRRSDWHGQWLETRQLSEYLRLGRHLFHIGALRDFVSLPSPGNAETMSEWYLRASFREIGLPSARLESAYLRVVLESALATEISEQRSYNASNAKDLTKIHHMLHSTGELCFSATIAFLLTYLAAWMIDSVVLFAQAHAEEVAHLADAEHGWFHEMLEFGIKPVVSIAAAALPALGAALSGINQQGDFESFAERSQATEGNLANAEKRIVLLLSEPAQPDLQYATAILVEMTDILSSDVAAWRQQFSRKRLALPA